MTIGPTDTLDYFLLLVVVSDDLLSFLQQQQQQQRKHSNKCVVDMPGSNTLELFFLFKEATAYIYFIRVEVSNKLLIKKV